MCTPATQTELSTGSEVASERWRLSCGRGIARVLQADGNRVRSRTQSEHCLFTFGYIFFTSFLHLSHSVTFCHILSHSVTLSLRYCRASICVRSLQYSLESQMILGSAAAARVSSSFCGWPQGRVPNFWAVAKQIWPWGNGQYSQSTGVQCIFNIFHKCCRTRDLVFSLVRRSEARGAGSNLCRWTTPELR